MNRLIIALLTAMIIFTSGSGIGAAVEHIVQPGYSIQTAVDNAVSGDVITVKPGTYTENIRIAAQNLTIRSESGNPEDTIVKVNNKDEAVISVNADNTTINGFKIIADSSTSYVAAVHLSICSNCTIFNNNLSDSYRGIYLSSSANNTIFDNAADSNVYGVILENSSSNNLTSNTANSNINYGFYLASLSRNNTLNSNIAGKNSIGFYLTNSSANIVSGNNISENTKQGIWITHSNYNTISGNIANNTSHGISLDSSDNNTLSGNIVALNDVSGIYICAGSDHNSVFNNYLNNTRNADIKNANNTWNKEKIAGRNIVGGPNTGGNFWAKPDGKGFSETATDTDKDGISDSQYNDINLTDYLPLAPVSDPLEPILPVANFSTNVTGGYAPLSVLFTDLSENATSRSWDFTDDGIGDANMSTIVYVYSIPGTYTVNLTATNENGTDSKSATITVSEKTEPAFPLASFSANVTTGYAPLSVQFNDTSTGIPGAWEWDFGDGSPNSTEQNPSHTYNLAGTYTVVLKVSNTEGYSTHTQTDYIKVLNNSDRELLTLVNTNLSQLSSIPQGMYLESNAPNVTLKYNNTLKCADITYVKTAPGWMYFSNLYPATDSNITYTLGTEGVSSKSYVNIIASSSLVSVFKQSNGDYKLASNWIADNESKQNSYITIPAANIVDNKVTFSVVCYESNRTNMLKYNDKIYTKTPFRTMNTRNQNYVFVNQPMVYFSSYLANDDTNPCVLHVYSIKQEIPRKAITPYGTRSVSALTITHPNPEDNGNGTNLMKSNGQKSTIYVSTLDLNSATVEYQKALLDAGWEMGIYYSVDLGTVSNETAIAIMDSEYNTIVNTFGRQPKTWAARGSSGNISQARYAYQRYGMIWRSCESGASWLSVGNLCNTYWRWWNTSITQGIVFPAFTITTDNEPATGSSINASYFTEFSNGFAANNIRLCGLNEYYFTQSAQNTTQVNITDSNDSYMRFTVKTSGYPCTLNVMTNMSDVEVSHDGVNVPYTSMDDGVVFTAKDNTTYELRSVSSPLIANFTSNLTSGNVPLTVQFNDTSTGSPTAWDWNFGDGTDSAIQNATHTFTTAGLYHVTLKASKNGSNSTITKDITISEQPVLPVANFSANVSEGYAPLPVQFNDSSENATELSWDFGNGVYSTEQNPIHIYNTTGNYTVNLTAINGNGADSKLATINVATLDVIPPQLISSIQSSPETTWINWTWVNPGDPNFNHVEIYLNSIFQVNTSAEYLNTTGLEPDTNYTISTLTADIYGNKNETWVNASAKTKPLPDVDQPVIESIVLFPTSTTTGSIINVTANVTDNVGISSVKANNISLFSQGGSVWNGNITALEGTQYVNVSAVDEAGNVAWNNSTSYTATTPDTLPPASITDLQSTSGTNWINWEWISPSDSDFNHIEIYLNGTFQTNTSAEYFNATDLEPDTYYTIGTRTVDIDGNVNETWVNATAATSRESVSDIEKPVIGPVMLFPANTIAGSEIDISANITDNTAVAEVTAGDVRLTEIEGVWKGNITAPSSLGKHFLLIKANDTAGNTANVSVPYNVVRRQGGVNIAVLPTVSKVIAGKNTTLTLKIKNTQNVDDTFKVRININGLPAFYRSGIPWFSWTEKTLSLKAKQEALIPIEVKIPAGTVTGLKLFKVNANSEKFSVQRSNMGYMIISRPRYAHK